MDEWTHIEDTYPRARKAYRCSLCERQIARGTTHVRRFGYDEKGPVSVRMHTRCEVLTHDWGEDEWVTMGAREFRQEYLAGEFLLSLLPDTPADLAVAPGADSREYPATDKALDGTVTP